MENNCMANPCEGCTEEACVEMMKKLQADVYPPIAAW